jgi:hypothetical protein
VGDGASAIGDQAADEALLASYAAVLKTAHAQATSLGSQNTFIAWVKFNRVGLDGRYRHEYTNRSDFTSIAGGFNDLSYPAVPQASVVVTLRTASKRGLANSGRLYMPTPGIHPGSDGRMSIANQTSSVTWAKNLLNAINAVDASLYIGISSKVRTGAQKRVTRVEIGRVIDTMRSRRSSLAEDYSGADLDG